MKRGFFLLLLFTFCQAQEQNFDPPPYVSYYGSTKCSNIVGESAGSAPSVNVVANYVCDSLQMPTAWQQSRDDGIYDLAIVGAGFSGAYLTNRIFEEFKKLNRTLPKLVLLERTSWAGGRLMSAQSAGGLGLAVQGRDKESIGFPPQEYGGMRIDPYEYPYVFRKAIESGKAIFGDKECLDIEECLQTDVNCCPKMFARMEVGLIRYATTRNDLGITSNSSIYNESEVYFAPGGKVLMDPGSLESNLLAGIGSPFDNCFQLAEAAQRYFSDNNLKTGLWKEDITRFCDECKNALPGSCELCAKFPGDAKVLAPLSCSGYDVFPPDQAQFDPVLGIMSEVLNTKGKTHLYLIKEGFQRFLQGLLFVNDTVPYAPLFGKQLTTLNLESGQDIANLSALQIESISSTPLDAEAKPSADTVILGFADGSTVRSKAAYLTMLPYDLPQIKGFEQWNETLGTYMAPGQAVKLVLGWKNASEAPAALFGLPSCVQSPCNRLILDGPAEDGWTIRQIWLWDPKTIMVYDISPKSSGTNKRYPGTNLVEIAQTEGMDALIQKVMQDFRNATKVNIPDPQWARLKPWPEGNLIPGWKSNPATNISGPTFATYLQRPLGADVPVWYGNSEASRSPSLHGWAEGGAEMVEDALPAIMNLLGVEGFQKFMPEKFEASTANTVPPANSGFTLISCFERVLILVWIALLM